MKWTEWLQETRKMRFEEAYEKCKSGSITHEDAALLLGVCDRTFRRYKNKYEEGGLDALLDKRLTLASHRCALVDEVMRLTEQYRSHYSMFFVDEEGTASSFKGIREVIEKHGLFCSFYSDRGSHYWHTPKAGGKVDKVNLTQFGDAMKRHGIEIRGIFATGTGKK